MTISAVASVVSKAVTEVSFRERLFSGGYSLNDLLKNNEFVGLDMRDAQAIQTAARTGNMREFGERVESYCSLRYPRKTKFPWR